MIGQARAGHFIPESVLYSWSHSSYEKDKTNKQEEFPLPRYKTGPSSEHVTDNK